jgi:hypothetical protein
MAAHIDEPDRPCLVDEEISRPGNIERIIGEAHIDAVIFRRLAIFIDEQGKWYLVLIGPFFYRISLLAEDSYQLRSGSLELFVILAQTEQLFSAVRSPGTPEEEQKRLAAFQYIRQAHRLAIISLECEIRRSISCFQCSVTFGHGNAPAFQILDTEITEIIFLSLISVISVCLILSFPPGEFSNHRNELDRFDRLGHVHLVSRRKGQHSIFDPGIGR